MKNTTVVCALIVAIGLIIMAISFSEMASILKTSTTSQPDSIVNDENVQIDVSCGTLNGSGAIVIINKKDGKLYKLPFTCPSFTK